MAVDTPATVAILGAGPIGLELALYARFLGYDVRIFERGEVADNVRRWGHVRMFTPFSMNSSTLGRAAIAAHDEHYAPPADDALLTGSEWREQYLLPLAATDLLADHLFLNTKVVAVSRWGAIKGALLNDERRTDTDFRILLAERTGAERTETAEVVFDTTGTFAVPNWIGPGGAPALGERTLREENAIEYGLPDVAGADREHYAGRHTLLVGNGYSAATTLNAFESLAAEAPGTRVTWLTPVADVPQAPIVSIEADRLPQRKMLAEKANALARDGAAFLTHEPTWIVTGLHREGSQFRVELMDIEAEQQRTAVFDRIVANVGYRGDWSLAAELQLHQCYATDAPMKIAAAMLANPSADCLDVPSAGPATLLNPEPNFYVLGAKSYGRNSQFLYQTGLTQIRDLFTIIGERANLDLYAGARSLPR